MATAPDGKRHPTAVTELTGALKDSIAGCYPARTAVATIKAALIDARWGDDRFKARADGGSEWTYIVCWSVAQVQHLTRDEVRAEIEQRRREALTKVLADREPPEADEYVHDLTDEELDRVRKDWAGDTDSSGGKDGDAGPFAHVHARFGPFTVKDAGWIADERNDGHPRWGTGEQPLWHRGEALLLGSPTGLGKTTLSGQAVRGVVGLQDEVLGHPIEPAERVILFALDRPRQIRRAFRRVFTDDELQTLERDRRLVIWDKPLPVTLNTEPDILAAIADDAGADVAFIDSLKDTVTKMSDDEAGLSINRAVQSLVGNGIDAMVNAHLRKVDTRPASVNDLFGSSNIVNGMGSVFVMWGAPGSGEAVLYALKSPADMPDEMSVVIDYETGSVDLAAPPWNALAYLHNSAASRGVTVQEAAHAKHNRDANSAEQKRVRRDLDKLVDHGKARREDGHKGGPGSGSTPARYWPVSDLQDLA